MTADKVKAAYDHMHNVLRSPTPLLHVEEMRLAVADWFSKLREAEEEGELTDDEFHDGLAEVEHFLWTGRGCE